MPRFLASPRKALIAIAPALALLPGACEKAPPGPPAITSVSTFYPQPNQTIIIKGHGFGTHQPFNGDVPVFQISDKTTDWNAGNNRWSADLVTVDVSGWTDDEIDVRGFTGSYGGGWIFAPGDKVEIDVWNAQTGTTDPAAHGVFNTVVVGVPTP